ncbi:MAG: fluoride efflux transporter CrcB [Alphaproteobacteria bacterium]|nr:fluoride efflux transporter CrcB [Alphaproteobacteria bacterium]
MNTIVAIAMGGALGAVFRHGVNVGAFKLFGDGFPWGTLGVNVIGSFIMGVLIAVFAQYWQPSHGVKLFLITGFLGAFTTFSTFSLDVSALWERGALGATALYVMGSVVLSVGALFLGLMIVRSLAS